MDGEMSGSRGRWAEYGRSDGPRVRRGRRGRGTACLASFSQAGGTAAGDGGIVHVSEADGSGRTGEQGKLQTGRRLMANETRRRCAEREPVAVHALLVGGESTSGQDEREQSAAGESLAHGWPWPRESTGRCSASAHRSCSYGRLPGCARHVARPSAHPAHYLAPTPPSNPRWSSPRARAEAKRRPQAEASSHLHLLSGCRAHRRPASGLQPVLIPREHHNP